MRLSKIKMEVKHELPPILERLNEKGVHPDTNKVIFTVGNVIYNPGKVNIPDHLEHHEKVHCKQQGPTEETQNAWWEQYIEDELFRIEQEVEAYARQYEFICKTEKNKENRNRIMMDLAKALSGPTYGNVIDFNGAMRLLKKEVIRQP